MVIGTFRNILPEAICCCYVDVMLDRLCILTFIVVTLLVV